jgi:hypothetical protein
VAVQGIPDQLTSLYATHQFRNPRAGLLPDRVLREIEEKLENDKREIEDFVVFEARINSPFREVPTWRIAGMVEPSPHYYSI